MIEKLSVEQFNLFKKQINKISGDHYNLKKNKNMMSPDEYKKEEDIIVKDYVKFRDKVLSYDLSSIPSDEWIGFNLNSNANYPADMSKTHANIDFATTLYSPYINYKSCNITSIDNVRGFLNEEHFDKELIAEHPEKFLPNTLNEEIKDKILSHTFTFDDYIALGEEGRQSLEKYDVVSFFDEATSSLIRKIDLNRLKTIYENSKEDFNTILEIFKLTEYSINYGVSNESLRSKFIDKLENLPANKIKKAFYLYLKYSLFERAKYHPIMLKDLPEQFIRENKESLLLDESIPDDVRERLYSAKLSYEDIFKYAKFLRGSNVHELTDVNSYQELKKFMSNDEILYLIDVYPEFMNYIMKGKLAFEFSIYYKTNKEKLVINEGDNPKEKIQEFARLYFQVIRNSFLNKEQLYNYQPEFFELSHNTKTMIRLFGYDNIIKFDQETGFFSYSKNRTLDLFDAVKSYLTPYVVKDLLNSDSIDFKFGELPYEEFRKEFAKLIERMKNEGCFNEVNYDFIQGKFREENPTLFIDYELPDPIKNAFYANRLSVEYLFNFRDYSESFKNLDLGNIIKSKATVKVPSLKMNGDFTIPKIEKFFEMYAKVYGNEKVMDLISTYGPLLDDIAFFTTQEDFQDEEKVNKNIRRAIYNKIVAEQVDYKYLLKNDVFVKEYPDMFLEIKDDSISPDVIRQIETAFYKKSLDFETIKKYPQLVDILKDKNVQAAFKFRERGLFLIHSDSDLAKGTIDDTEIITLVGNEKFLEMCAKYGDYLKNIPGELMRKNFEDKQGIYHMDKEQIEIAIQDLIIKECRFGNKCYDPETAPDFLKERAPDLFLDEDAPEELCKYYYTNYHDYSFNFDVLKNHKEWIPYLKGKCITSPFIKYSRNTQESRVLFRLFSDEEVLKLASTRTEVVKKMIYEGKVGIMKKWYDKTGKKFIPDHVVMLNFDENEIDKFLTNSQNWSRLMRIKNFAETEESRDAMLKLAYSFGAFDNDQRGVKIVQDLLSDVPRKIESEQSYVLLQLDNILDMYGKRDKEFNNVNMTDQDEAFERCIDNIKYNKFRDPVSYDKVVDLLIAIKKEMPDFNFKEQVFTQLYKENEDHSYSLNFLAQSYPKTTQALRIILDSFIELNLISPTKAHQLFSGFDMNYNPEFREFFMKNIDEILSNSEYSSYIPRIQKQFDDIKRANINRALTLDLAISYVQTNKFTDIETGNEKVAEVSSIAGYTQNDFGTLQKIYNYGKQRTYSSIPRIENNTEKKSGKFTYEMLRLDDPLALAIGTLSDCCQEIHNCAEMCVEHSMVDKNGRVFVVRDENNNVVAQSWVWRNKDVLCFDNIEIPNKAFDRALKIEEVTKESFSKDIYDVYKEAAKELIEEDEKVYKQLLDEGKITQEQYDGLRLGKVTVGLGFNDIANAIQNNGEVDKGIVSHPLDFKPVVELNRGLYTNDSATQYIIEEREGRKPYQGETIPVHSDTFVEHTDDDFKISDLLRLEKLEILTKDNPYRLNTDLQSYGIEKEFVSTLAYNYNLNPKTTRVILHPNFAIIYDSSDDKVTIGDLLFNTNVKDNEGKEVSIEDKVVIQLRLALEQIGNNKLIDSSRLNEKQIDIYNKAVNLTEEIDIERGVGHAR